MSHFAARTRFPFSVKVKVRTLDLHGGGPVWFAALPQVAEQIRHGSRPKNLGRAQRQPANRADMLFELTRDAAFNRPMTRIMRARRQLVDEEGAVRLEKHFNCQETHEIRFFRD